jgi:hypothetical protein
MTNPEYSAAISAELAALYARSQASPLSDVKFVAVVLAWAVSQVDSMPDEFAEQVSDWSVALADDFQSVGKATVQ